MVNRIDFKIKRKLTAEEVTAFDVVKKLQQAGYEAYIAGGAVRDELLGIPAYDIDIATSAKPEEIKKLFPRSYDRGKAFGVVAVRMKLSSEQVGEFEVATFRSDIGIFDHRRPKKIAFTSAAKDAQRRDFTINGLFYDSVNAQIIDYVGGIKDLKNKIIRFIGQPQERINEDYLRILRAVRFANRFGFVLDEEGAEAIKENAIKIQGVSAERVRDELAKMFVHPSRVKAIEMLESLGLLEQILPELVLLHGVQQPPEFHHEGDVWIHTMLALKNLSEAPSEELVWAVLLHDIAKPETQGFRQHPKSKITFFEHDVESAKKEKKILGRLKYSNDFIENVAWAISQHMRLINAFREDGQQMSERKQEKLFLDPRINLLLDETRADLLASVRPDGTTDLSMYENALKRKKYFASRPAEEKEQVKKFDLITGHDIMKVLKFPSGPKVGQVKAKIEEAFLEGKISRRDEALKMIEELQ